MGLQGESDLGPQGQIAYRGPLRPRGQATLRSAHPSPLLPGSPAPRGRAGPGLGLGESEPVGDIAHESPASRPGQADAVPGDGQPQSSGAQRGDPSEESLAGEGSGGGNHSVSPQQGSASSRDMDPAVGQAMQIGISATPAQTAVGQVDPGREDSCAAWYGL